MVTTDTTANTRTLRAYAMDLLETARWIIEREVDFTDCRHGARYDAVASTCGECQFGSACRWLDSDRTPKLDTASLDELVEAIKSACEYLEASNPQREVSDVDWHHWIHKAHRLLRARRA